MEDKFLLRREHEEFSKRMEDDHERMKARIKNLEVMNKQINDLIIATNEIAVSVRNLTEAQRAQSSRLENLESRDGELWRKLIGYIISGIVGILVGFLFKQVGIF